jgi:arabinofuranosyltransferase
VTARGPALALVLIAGLAAAHILVFAGSLIDDAYIFFRYADHLLAGLGPVFNPGERVEGFTSPLWLLLLTVARGAGLQYAMSVTVFGLLAAVLTLIPVYLLARQAAPPVAALVAPLLLALHPGQAMWAVHGLETALFILLLTSGWAAATVAGAPLAAGLLLGAAFWARPEAVLAVAVLAAARLLSGRRVATFRLLLGAALAALPLLVMRWAYYGTLVPNTFHAKSGGGLQRIAFGLFEARRFVTAHAPLVLACTASAIWLLIVWRRDRATTGRVQPTVAGEALALGLVWSAWNVWVGGDGFFGFRFWLPALPAAGILLAFGITSLAAGTRRRMALPGAALAAGTLLLVVATAAGAWPEARREQVSGARFTARMLQVGTWLQQNLPAGTTLAVNYVGALPYASGMVTYDMLGLTEPAVAGMPRSGRFRYPGHASGNGDAILAREPGLLLMNGVYFESRPMVELAPQLESEEEIAADPRFARDYQRVQVQVETLGGTRWLAFYKRRDLNWEPVQ